MRRKLIGKCLIVFVIFYLTGGIYFYALSSGGNDVRPARDYDEHSRDLKDSIEPEVEGNIRDKSNVVIEYNEDFEKTEAEARANKLNGREIRAERIVKDSENAHFNNKFPSTKNRHPRKLMDNAKDDEAKYEDKQDKSNDELSLNTNGAYTNVDKKDSRKTYSQNNAINLNNTGYDNEEKNLERLIQDKAKEYIRKKFLNQKWTQRITATPRIPDLANDSESKEINDSLSLGSVLQQNLSVSNETDKGRIVEAGTFPRSSLPIENVNFQQAFPSVYIYSAFIDDRTGETFVRIVLVARSNKNVKPLWCHFRSAIGPSVTVYTSEMAFYETCENHMKEHAAYIGSCKVPDVGYFTEFVTLSNDPTPGTGISFHMSTIQNKFRYGFKQKFTTCVPPLFGNVTVLRLVEFIEMSRLLGVEHFVFYFNKFDKEVGHLLNYYSHQGIATILPWNMKMNKHQLWYHGQSAAVWDCLFRTMFISEWVSFNDIDEYLIPQKHKTWTDMFDDMKNSHPKVKLQNVAVYRFYSAFFDSSFKNFQPKNLTESSQFLTMNITTRTSQVSKVRTKMIVYPPKVFEIGIHHLSKPMEEHFQCVTVDSSFAILNHYRSCDWNYGMNCENVMYDNKTLHYHDNLLIKVKNRLIRAKEFISKNKLIN